MKHVTTETFATEVLEAELPVLVDFWADWCGPCLAMAPVLDEVALENAERLTVVKVDVDQSPDIPTWYCVRGIPTLILFKGGMPIATKVGATPKAALLAFLNGYL